MNLSLKLQYILYINILYWHLDENDAYFSYTLFG